LSRRNRPKFLYDLLGSGQTLIQSTYERLARVCGEEHVVVSTGEAHVDSVREQLPSLREDGIFAEPVARDSTAAIALATAVLARRHGSRIVVGSFAADHVIRDNDAFAECVRQAAAAARHGYITTIGIAASRPSTAFGYIHQGHSLAGEIPDAPSARIVRSFVEKPDSSTAQAYLQTGEYRWNAGMFVMRADVLLDSLKQYQPDLFSAICAIADAWDQGEECRKQALRQHWYGLEKIAFDYAIAEPLSAEVASPWSPEVSGGTISAISTLWPRCCPVTTGRTSKSSAIRMMWSFLTAPETSSPPKRAERSLCWVLTTWWLSTRPMPSWSHLVRAARK
jgi:mannose-1-phosphate guanylyltransferase